MPEFTIVQISDLHIGKAHPSNLDVLRTAIKNHVHDSPHPRLLVVTGDLVDSPTAGHLETARVFLQQLLSDAGFKDLLLVRGNHDAKRILGNLFMSRNFHEVFNAKASVREPHLHVIGVDSNGGLFARGRIGKPEYNRFLQEVSAADDGVKPLRIVAVHHHPMPLASGEGFREFGVKDEAYMYLESPATFLEACATVGVPLVLHGHRHVTGYVRYSIPVQRPITSNDDPWQNIYVLSCPSSTGISAEPAGFNIITPTGRALQIKRIQRDRSGAFRPLDRHLPNEALTLPLSIESIIDLDAALKIANDIQHRFSERPAPERDLYGHITNLFTRRAFAATAEDSAADMLYAVIATHHAWQNTIFPFLRSERHEAAHRVLTTLYDFEDSLCHQLGISGAELDGLRSRYIYDKLEFIKRIPQHPDTTDALRAKKKEFLARLKDALRAMNLPIAPEAPEPTAPKIPKPLAVPETAPELEQPTDSSTLWKRFTHFVHVNNFQENWRNNVYPYSDEIKARLATGDDALLDKVLGGFTNADVAIAYLAYEQLSSVRDDPRFQERIANALAPIAKGKNPHARFYAYGLLHYFDPSAWPRNELERLYRADAHEIYFMTNVYGKFVNMPLKHTPFATLYAEFKPRS